MATNDYLAFATGGGAQILPQATYAADPNTLNGRPAGVWPELYINKTARQACFGPACLGNLIVNTLGVNAPDDGNVANYTTNLTNLMSSLNSGNIILNPQGRLTLSTGVPLINADVLAATTIFYTAYVGNIVPVWNGTTFSLLTFAADLSLAITNTITVANGLYDIFAFNNAGSLQIGIGPVWSTITAGSSARGSGAGTTQISRLNNGLWTNTVGITLKNGASTFGPIAANQATYLGSIFVDGTAGQVTCHVSAGQSRKWGVWNAYNRQKVILTVTDTTASWTSSGLTIRAINNNSANSLQSFTGLQLEPIILNLNYTNSNPINASTIAPTAGIGYNSLTTLDNSAVLEADTISGSTPWGFVTYHDPESTAQSSFGLNTYTGLEQQGGAGTGTFTAQGTLANFKMTAEYRA